MYLIILCCSIFPSFFAFNWKVEAKSSEQLQLLFSLKSKLHVTRHTSHAKTTATKTKSCDFKFSSSSIRDLGRRPRSPILLFFDYLYLYRIAEMGLL